MSDGIRERAEALVTAIHTRSRSVDRAEQALRDERKPLLALLSDALDLLDHGDHPDDYRARRAKIEDAL